MMHRLVQRAVKFWMQKAGILDECMEFTVSHIAKVFPEAK